MRTANVLMGKKNKLVSAAQIGLLSVLFLLYFFPFMFVVVNSFKSTKEFLTNPIAIPLKLEFSNYITAFEKMRYTYAFVNSLIITVLSVALIAICSAMTAYVFVRKKWKINTYMFFIMVASMIIPFQAIMIPLVKIYGSIGMLNSKWALIYMYIGFGAPLAVFIYHGFLKSIPLELEEAAMIDGCSKLQIFFKIVFPLLKPTTMTIVILDMLWIWNDFLLPSLVLINPINRTLPLSTFYFFGTYTVDYGLLMAGLMMTMIPVIVVYLFLQKHIIKGVMQGSIK
ncbi:MAG: maltose transport system permease protein [Petroclostridium sp.]|jgi:raffinose/stachyose/melibiose transport system permease protein|nr:maltose transport system permease protein [Petroclostridium sp.]